MTDDLWMVQAVIQPFKLDAVTLALEELPGFGGMTVVECRGFGREKPVEPKATEGERESGDRQVSSGLVDFTPKLLVEAAVAGKHHARAVMDAISRAAHTGRRGDGKIFVWPLARAVCVRTFDENERAL